MNTRIVWIVVVGIMAMVSCTVAQRTYFEAERRAALQERYENARSYSDFLQARFASLTGDPHRAANHFSNSAKLNPDDVDLLERAVFAALLSGDVASAHETAKAAPKKTLKRSALPRLVVAVRDLKAGNIRRARRTLQPRNSTRFNEMIARSLYAWTLAEQNGTDAALALLDEAPMGDTLRTGFV